LADYGIVLVTVDAQHTALEIANALVSDRLAACVNLFPIHSVYRWEGRVQQEAEWQLVIKTDLGLFDAIVGQLEDLHPYDVPEVIALPISHASEPYLSWLAAQTKPRS
jgi:periplasmic divalent cation tolerance protein